eukprot:7992166-Pyramimonas_sp.AAC.1
MMLPLDNEHADYIIKSGKTQLECRHDTRRTAPQRACSALPATTQVGCDASIINNTPQQHQPLLRDVVIVARLVHLCHGGQFRARALRCACTTSTHQVSNTPT